jgi:hypothetical protein
LRQYAKPDVTAGETIEGEAVAVNTNPAAPVTALPVKEAEGAVMAEPIIIPATFVPLKTTLTV